MAKYEFAIFPDQEETRPVPNIGDFLVVTDIVRDVLDFHYGKCTVVVVEPREATAELREMEGE